MDSSITASESKALLSLVETLFRQMQGGSQRAWLELQLSVPQLKVLYTLVTAGPQSPGNLADILHVSPATVTGLCEGLVGRGLAVRNSNPSDRRSHLMVATQHGVRLVTELWAAHQEMWRLVVENLSADERRLVAEAFRVMLRAVERLAVREREASGPYTD